MFSVFAAPVKDIKIISKVDLKMKYNFLLFEV